MEIDDEIEQRIDEFFEENYAALQLEGGHALAPEARVIARHQVHMYWRKLREIAEHVTDTEVHLSLPLQKSPQGRTYTIEGVVDIVRDDERVVMYDIKTHDAEAIEANIEEYERQLNVYAHIWQNVRGLRLNQTAVICTQLPESLKDALQRGDAARVEYELARWQPVLPTDLELEHVAATIAAFGETVDCIEDGAFARRGREVLRSKQAGAHGTFATNVCRNCDARFSCASYRAYMPQATGSEARFRQYIEDFGDDVVQGDRNTAALAE